MFYVGNELNKIYHTFSFVFEYAQFCEVSNSKLQVSLSHLVAITASFRPTPALAFFYVPSARTRRAQGTL